MSQQPIELWVCATRDWIDPDGKGHGPRFTTVSRDRWAAEASAESNMSTRWRAHPNGSR